MTMMAIVMMMMISTSSAKLHVHFTTPPAHSHVNLLRELAIGLKEEFPDKYRITFGTSGKFTQMSTEVGLETINLADNRPKCQTITTPEFNKLMVDVVDPFERFQQLGGIISTIWDCQYVFNLDRFSNIFFCFFSNLFPLFSLSFSLFLPFLLF